jgi:hypothetical protein
MNDGETIWPLFAFIALVRKEAMKIGTVLMAWMRGQHHVVRIGVSSAAAARCICERQ